MEDIAVKQEAAAQEKKRPEIKTPQPKKKRKWLKRLILILTVVLVVAFLFFNPFKGGAKTGSTAFIPTAADVRDLVISVSSTGTVRPIDSYKVTAMVKGEVLESPFEVGDKVSKDDLLYRIDSKDVLNTIQRSEISLAQSQLSYNDLLKNKGDSQKNLDIKANAAGVVQKLYYKVGESAAAGTPIADILDRENMLLTVPFHAADAQSFYVGQAATVTVGGSYESLSGTVDSVAVTDEAGLGGTLVRAVTIRVKNPGALSDASTGTASVGAADCAATGNFAYGAKKTLTAKTSGEITTLTIREGDWVNEDQLVGAFKGADMDTQIENARLSLQSVQLSLQATKDQLESYTITSPISGTVIEKSVKTGDNVGNAVAGSYLAVIYDMSVLTFEMNIHELDIGKIQVGQTVQITADALEGENFTGKVDKININGNTVNGVTTYPVTVVIDNPENMLPGMNVSAEIVVEKVSQVLSVPVEAVSRGSEGAQVTVALPGALSADGTQVVDTTKLSKRTVKLGRNDETNIEITDGLAAGDVVVIANQASNPFAMMGMGG